MPVLPVLLPVAGVPVAPADPVAAPCVPPLMSLVGGVPLVPVPAPVPVLPAPVLPDGREPLALPLEPLPDEEPLMPPGVAPDVPVPVWPVGFVDDPLDVPVDEPLPDEPLPLVPLPDEPLPDEPLPDVPLPDVPLPDVPLMPLPLIEPPLMLPLPEVPLPDVLLRARRRLWCRVERFFVPVLSCIEPLLVALLAPAVLPEPVEPVPPVDVCAEAASGSTAIVASVVMRFRMGPFLSCWFVVLLLTRPPLHGGRWPRLMRVAFHRTRRAPDWCSGERIRPAKRNPP